MQVTYNPLIKLYSRDFIDRMVRQYERVLEARRVPTIQVIQKSYQYWLVLMEENKHHPPVHIVNVGKSLLKYGRKEIEKGIKKNLDEISD